MRHVSRTRRVALDWLCDRVNLDPKIQIKYIDTKNQLANILTKGNFTRDGWNHLLCLFNVSHFSSTVCSEAMAKRVQQDSGEERVTAKSRPMMSLTARASSTLSSSASESQARGRKAMKVRAPGVRKLKNDRTERPVVECHKQFIESSYSARYSRWDDDKAWSSQEWKSDTSMCDRTGQPVVTFCGKTHESQSSFFHEKTQHVICEEEEPHDRTVQPVVIPQREIRPQQFIIGNDETESELSFGSRSFFDWVNDQVRKRQKRSSMNVTENDEKHSMIWKMFMSSTLQSSVFMVESYSENWHSITNTKDLTLKQMFDISTRLMSEQDEISGVETIGCENHSWKYLSLIGDERVINLQRTKVYVFSDSVLCHGKIHENTPIERRVERKIGVVQIISGLQKFWTELTASQWNSSGVFSQDSIRCSSVKKSKFYC